VEHCEIRFSGSGGQGLILSARTLATALTLDGKKVAQSQSYEPTSRGGLSRSDLVVAQETVDYPLTTKLDYLIILDQVAAHVSLDLLTKDSIVILDQVKVSDPPVGKFTHYSFPLTEAALELGNVRATNIVALGALVALGQFCSRESGRTGARLPVGGRWFRDSSSGLYFIVAAPRLPTLRPTLVSYIPWRHLLRHRPPHSWQ